MIQTLEKQEQLLDQLKACVHCGICLSSCPTYLVSGNEGNSPRGRLYMIRDLVDAERRGEWIREKEDMIDYLDNCLNCQACETACPSGVEYANILDYARHEKNLSNYKKGKWARFRGWFFTNVINDRKELNKFRSYLELSAKLGLNWIGRYIIGPFVPIFKFTPRLQKSYKEIRTNFTYRSKEELELSDEKRTLSFNLGCVMDSLYNHVHWDTIKVLNNFGYHLFIDESVCCGALAAHSGEHEIGQDQAIKTLSNLNSHKQAAVINSAGCSAYLKKTATKLEKKQIELKANQHRALNFTTANSPILDPVEAIARAPLSLDEFAKKLKTPKKKLEIIYHPACHLNHAQGIKDEYIELLKLIPNLEITKILEEDVCCGSAGFYNLIKPEMANAIGERKAKFIKDKGTNKIIVSANPGCLNQIQAMLPGVEIVHPLSLLAQLL